jgi:hypothetical protein
MKFDFSACTPKKVHSIMLTNIHILIIPTEMSARYLNKDMKRTETLCGRYTFI